MKIVIDSSVWIAGIGSRTGFASEVIFKSYKNADIEIVISSKIMVETKRNLIGKLKFDDNLAEETERIINNLCDYKIEISAQEEQTIKKINLKDRHILALCKKAQADFLITFDRKHLLPLEKIGPTIILEPKDFIEYIKNQKEQNELPRHNYRRKSGK